MIPIFHFNNNNQTNNSIDLLLEIGYQSVSYLMMEGTDNCIELGLFHLPKSSDNQLETNLNEILSTDSFKNKNFRKINIVFSFPEAVMIPDEFMFQSAAKELLGLVYGYVSTDDIKSDIVYKQNLHVVYVVPKTIITIIHETLHQVNYSHLYAQLSSVDLKNTEAQLVCIFDTNSFAVSLSKNEKIQIIQRYKYNNPEDVSFYLLQICGNYNVNIQSCTLQLFGMIDISSNLYNELYKYFMQIEFGTIPKTVQLPEDMKEYPAHYFAHLFLLASCV